MKKYLNNKFILIFILSTFILRLSFSYWDNSIKFEKPSSPLSPIITSEEKLSSSDIILLERKNIQVNSIRALSIDIYSLVSCLFLSSVDIYIFFKVVLFIMDIRKKIKCLLTIRFEGSNYKAFLTVI